MSRMLRWIEDYFLAIFILALLGAVAVFAIAAGGLLPLGSATPFSWRM